MLLWTHPVQEGTKVAKTVPSLQRVAKQGYRRRRTLRPVAIALLLACCLTLPTAAGASSVTGPHRSGARAVEPAGATKVHNADFNGTWEWAYAAYPDRTGTLTVQDEDMATGSFDGTVVHLGPSELSGAFDFSDGQVTGDSFSFDIERDDVGSDDATFTADVTGTIDGNKATGDIDANLDPPPESCEDGGDDCPVLGGAFTATRETFTVEGEITAGCGDCGGGEPFEGMDVEVDGDNGSASATTDDEGKWDVELPAGQYTVTPTDPVYHFTPPDRDIDLEDDVDGQDFTACAMTEGDQNSAVAAAVTRRAAGKTVYHLSGQSPCRGGNGGSETFTVSYATGHDYVLFIWTMTALDCRKFGQSLRPHLRGPRRQGQGHRQAGHHILNQDGREPRHHERDGDERHEPETGGEPCGEGDHQARLPVGCGQRQGSVAGPGPAAR